MTDVYKLAPIDGVRRSFVEARGVRFHVTESGPQDGRPVLALHGWPQHHWVYRDLLADPPPGLRIIAPDLPGYGWSGPAPHKWAKDDVADDVLALMDAMGLDRVLLVGHDWGGYVGYRMVLRAPERFDGYLVLEHRPPVARIRCRRRRISGGSGTRCGRTVGIRCSERTNVVQWVIFEDGPQMRSGETPRSLTPSDSADPVRAPSGPRYLSDVLTSRNPGRAQGMPEMRRATVPIRRCSDRATRGPPVDAAAETARPTTTRSRRSTQSHFSRRRAPGPGAQEADCARRGDQLTPGSGSPSRPR